MITRTLPRAPRQAFRLSVTLGRAGYLALLLSAAGASAQSSQDLEASPKYDSVGVDALYAQAASPAQVQHTEMQRSGQVPSPSQYQGTGGGSSLSVPPAIRNAQGESTNASREAEAANRDMQAELEPVSGGLTADEVIRIAFENSPTLRKAELDVSRTDANQARAKLAFAPRFDVGASYQRLSSINLPPFDLGPSLRTVLTPQSFQTPEEVQANLAANPALKKSPFSPFLNVWAITASVQLPVTDIFLTILPTYKMTKKMHKYAELQRDAQKLQLSYDARIAFWEYARLRGNASVARASVRVREAGVRDLTALVQAGTATQTELVRAQGDLEVAKTAAIQAEGGVETARARLEQLMGREVDPQRGIGEAFVNIDVGQTPNIEQVRSQARQQRPELLALNSLLEARDLQLKARKGGMWPKINARGDFLEGKPNPRFVPPLNEFKPTGSATVSIGWSPNDVVYAYTQKQDAEWDMQTVREDQRNFELGIIAETANAVTAHRTAVSTIESSTAALEGARRYEADQRALLLAGSATPNDLLLAQRDLLAASFNWVNAFIAGREAQAAVLKARGETGIANK